MLLNKLIEDVLQRNAVQWITGMESGRCNACRSILHVSSSLQPYNFVFPSALAFAHLALAAADSLALTAGLLRQSFLAGLDLAFPFAFALAHRIFRARARAFMSLRRWAADM